MTPVAGVYEMTDAPEREVEETLLLKSVQSAEESLPVFAAEATGRLKVIVFPLAVTVKSVPVVEVARVTAGPVWREPAGPIEVTAAVRPWVRQVPLTAKHPAERFTPFAKVELAAPATFRDPPMFAEPVMRVEVPAPVTAKVVEVAFVVVPEVTTAFEIVAFVATKVFANRFVDVALVVVPLTISAPVADRFASSEKPRIRSAPAWMPPAKVEVAVEVAMIAPTVGVVVTPSDPAPVQNARAPATPVPVRLEPPTQMPFTA
jgi:hypothetical protein